MMSRLLHPNEDDEAFAAAHADAAIRTLLNRVWRLTFLLRAIREKSGNVLHVKTALGHLDEEVDRALKLSWRDEPDDGSWRFDEPEKLPRLPGEPIPPCGVASDVWLADVLAHLECDREQGHDGLHHCKFGRSVVTWSDE